MKQRFWRLTLKWEDPNYNMLVTSVYYYRDSTNALKKVKESRMAGWYRGFDLDELELED